MIYCKLDYYTCTLNNVSISYVLKRLNCYDSLYEDVLTSAYDRTRGYDSNVTFCFSGVCLEVKWVDYMSVSYEKLLDSPFSYMRVEFSGSGLDFLRYFNPDLDKDLSQLDFWEGHLKNLTRCDFSFDFVNYYSDFLNEFTDRLHELEHLGFLSTRRLGGHGQGKSFKYEVRRGSMMNCVYLGSRGGNRLIRIYDKLLERTKDNGALKSPHPEIFAENGDKEVDSWFRFELQTRNKYAYEYLFNCEGDLTKILREIFDDIKLVDPEFKETFECLRKLTDFSALPKIVYNLHFTELPVKVIDRDEAMIDKYAGSIIRYIGAKGHDKFVSRLENYLYHINFPITKADINRNLGFRMKYVRTCRELGVSELNHLRLKDNKFSIVDVRSNENYSVDKVPDGYKKPFDIDDIYERFKYRKRI